VNRPQVIAHRGASAQAPENTLAAFRRALALGVDGVELDVHLSADGEPVVLHDSAVDRTTDGTGLVRDMTLAALRRLDAGRWFGEAFAGERIPTLAEALEVLRGVRVIVEIKNGPIYYPKIADRVVAVVRAIGHPAVTFSSFDHPALLEVRRVDPAAETAVLFMGRPVDPVALAVAAGARRLHAHWMWVTADVVAAVHRAGLAVEVWPVDDPVPMAHLAALGVDGIITSHPDRLQAVLADRRAVR